MIDSFENIKSIVNNVLGSPKRDYSGSGGWYEYNCPNCADEKGYTDNKYNFAVQIGDEGLWGHCWRCGYHGKLSKVIKKYGTPMDMSEYKDEVSAIKESRYFTLSVGTMDNINDLLSDDELMMPNGFSLIDKDRLDCKEAVNYLNRRGVDFDIISKYNIGYVPDRNGRYSKRVVIPSYDAYGDLNYWVARDYSGKSKTKIINPEVDKKRIVFNEYHINWYEPITLVEGPFDHIVVPNSIPLLGKTIDEECEVFRQLVNKSHSNINILLDYDAISDAYKLYKFLRNMFSDRVRVIECPDGYDASDYYRDYGKSGIISLMRRARKLNDYELSVI